MRKKEVLKKNYAYCNNYAKGRDQLFFLAKDCTYIWYEFSKIRGKESWKKQRRDYKYIYLDKYYFPLEMLIHE